VLCPVLKYSLLAHFSCKKSFHILLKFHIGRPGPWLASPLKTTVSPAQPPSTGAAVGKSIGFSYLFSGSPDISTTQDSAVSTTETLSSPSRTFEGHVVFKPLCTNSKGPIIFMTPFTYDVDHRRCFYSAIEAFGAMQLQVTIAAREDFAS